jgi:ABC-2 type transport system ATP-binding protein
MKLLSGFLSPNEGTAKIGGFDVSTHRLEAAKILGYLPENGPLYTEMTPASTLQFLGEARGMASSRLKDRMEFVANKCSLRGVWGKPISKLSKGYRQRVGMAQALLHDPDVLILDEPTSGLDPNQTHDVRQLILSLGKTKTILLSTHILTEVKAVCSRVILIDEGRLKFDGSIEGFEGSQHNMEGRFRELTAA